MNLKVRILRGETSRKFFYFTRPKTPNPFLKKICKKHDFEGAYTEGGNFQNFLSSFPRPKTPNPFLKEVWKNMILNVGGKLLENFCLRFRNHKP